MNDVDNIRNAFSLLMQAKNNHKEIETHLWAGISWIFLIRICKDLGYNYEYFCEQINIMMEYSKSCWDNDN